mmetsp:Transcript_87294/g.154697  ORF Transcript_87294/g.154697 Transcript_87294/m.154697 type:complete len:201 (+) Transcript_87294:481-1083(+)
MVGQIIYIGEVLVRILAVMHCAKEGVQPRSLIVSWCRRNNKLSALLELLCQSNKLIHIVRRSIALLRSVGLIPAHESWAGPIWIRMLTFSSLRAPVHGHVCPRPVHVERMLFCPPVIAPELLRATWESSSRTLHEGLQVELVVHIELLSRPRPVSRKSNTTAVLAGLSCSSCSNAQKTDQALGRHGSPATKTPNSESAHS